MFLPVHMAVGATIDKTTGGGWLRKLCIVAPLAFMTHPLLDYFNYGDNTLFHGPMDGTLNAVIIAVSVILAAVLVIRARRYWVGMLFADIADFEWVIFGLTGWDKYQGLHHKLFWPHILTTEWGLLVQLALCILIMAAVLLPSRKLVWRRAPTEAKVRVKEESQQRTVCLSDGLVVDVD